MESNINVICLETTAFYALVKEVVDQLKSEHAVEHDQWIPDVEAMRLLGIKSKSTMQRLRDEGKIRFSQPSRKLILYDRNSIFEYLDANAKNTF